MITDFGDITEKLLKATLSPNTRTQSDFLLIDHWITLHRLGMESEETTSTEINNPGAYSTVCVELDVASLAVNTIIEVPHLFSS